MNKALSPIRFSGIEQQHDLLYLLSGCVGEQSAFLQRFAETEIKTDWQALTPLPFQLEGPDLAADLGRADHGELAPSP